VRVPDGLNHLPEYQGKALKLRKALYSLKQAGRVWNMKIHVTLLHLGYTRTRTDACVYVRTMGDGTRYYIALYVDDLLFVGPQMVDIDRVKAAFASEFGIKDLGAAEFILGIQIPPDGRGGYWIDQRSYWVEVLARFGMSNASSRVTPMEPGLQLCKNDTTIDPVLKTRYMQAVGSLMYGMLGTRPDLAHAVSYLSRFSDNPGLSHWAAVVHVLHYIAGTLDLGVLYAASSNKMDSFAAYTNADWGACVNTSKSTMGYVFTLCGGAISWNSKQQNRVANSSTDAEYIGIGHAGKELVHIDMQLGELGEAPGRPVTLFGDNQGAIALTKEARFHERTKHVRIAEHFAREMVETGAMRVEYINTNDMVADIMTKSLHRPLFEKFRAAMGVRPMPL
jgi:hypothetical protein